MWYRERAKARKFRAKIIAFVNLFKFKLFISSKEWKLVLLGCIISIFSLFMPWMSSTWGEIISSNAFSIKLGYIWFIILLLNLIMIFLVLSNKRKEKLKLNLSLSFRDYFVVNTFSGFILLLCFVSASFIRWLLSFSQNIIIWQWIIYCLVWTMFSFWGWYLLYKQYKKDYANFIVENSSQVWENVTDDRNMKLPF